jgi:hypothetical protein
MSSCAEQLPENVTRQTKSMIFQETGWADHPVGEMEVTVKSPTVKHRIPVVRVTNWLRSAGSPREVALKTRLRQMLGWNG